MFCWLLWQRIWFFKIYCCQSHCLLRSLPGRQKAPCARVCLDTHDFHKGLEIHKQNKPQQHFHYVYYSRALCVIALIWPDESYVRGLWAADPAALTYKIFHVSSHAALWFTTPGTRGQQGASEKPHWCCNSCIKKINNVKSDLGMFSPTLAAPLWLRTEVVLCVCFVLRDDVFRSGVPSAVFLWDSCLYRETQLRIRLSADAIPFPSSLNLEQQRGEVYFSEVTDDTRTWTAVHFVITGRWIWLTFHGAPATAQTFFSWKKSWQLTWPRINIFNNALTWLMINR